MAELQHDIHQTAVEKGWWPTAADGTSTRQFGEILALMHSELSEALEAWRDNVGNLVWIPQWDAYGVPDKPEGVAVELADCVIRIADWFESEGLDLQQVMEMKHEYNKTRSFRHGNKRA